MQPPLREKLWTECFGPCLQNVLSGDGVAAHVTCDHDPGGDPPGTPSVGAVATVRLQPADLGAGPARVAAAQARWEVFRRPIYRFVDWHEALRASLAAMKYCPAAFTIVALSFGPASFRIAPTLDWRGVLRPGESAPTEQVAIPIVTLRLEARQIQSWQGLQFVPEIRDRLLNWKSGFFHGAAVSLGSFEVAFADASFGPPLQLVPPID